MISCFVSRVIRVALLIWCVALCFPIAAKADISLAGRQLLGDNSNEPVRYDQLREYPFYFSLSEDVSLSSVFLNNLTGLENDSSLVIFIDDVEIATGNAGNHSVPVSIDLTSGLHTLALRGSCYDDGTLVPCSGTGTTTILSIADLAERFVDPVTKLVSGDLNSSYRGANQSDGVEITGDANRDIDLRNGNDRLYIHGNNNSNASISLSNGSDIVRIGGDKNGALSLGSGSNQCQIDGNANNASITGGNQTDTIKIKGSVNTTISLGNGNDEVEILGNVNGDLSMGKHADRAYIHGAVYGSGVDMGDGDDTLQIDGQISSSVDGGSGSDTLYVNMTEAEWNSSSQRFNVTSFETILFTDSPAPGLDEDDFWFDEIVLQTADPSQSSDSIHLIRKYHLGDSSDSSDGYDPTDSTPYYPDSADGTAVTLNFTLAAETSSLTLDFYRLRALDVVNLVSIDGVEIGTLSPGGDTVDLADDPYQLIVEGNWGAGSHSLRIEAGNEGGGWWWSDRDDFCWDQIILTPSGSSSFCFFDDFDRGSLGSNWSIIKQENFTPTIVDNKLVLTDTAGSIASGVALKGSFPSQDNYVEIEFEVNAYGGSGADGIVLVLSDAAVVPVAGAYGGSLGYANRTGRAGFSGGWLGFGIDEFGNFSNPTEGRNGGPGKRADSVSVRGHGDSADDYLYLVGTGTLNPGIDDRSSADASPGHLYRFSIDTRNNKTLIKVERDSGSGFVTLIDWADVTQNALAPDNFRISFTGSTGGSTNIHSIDDFKVSALYCGTIGQAAIDHFEFIHDGQGLTCAAEEVTLKACLDSTCSEVYSGEVQLQLPDIGWIGGPIQTVTFPASGQVSLKLHHTTAEPVTLGVIVSTPDTSVATTCSGGNPNACEISFADSGFLIQVPDGRSCTDLQGTIQAVRRDNVSNLCVGDDSFAELTKSVAFSFGYDIPDNGDVEPSVDDTTLGTTSPGDVVDLYFNDQALASFDVQYRDAGSLNLYARHDGSGDSAGLVMLGSTAGSFVVAPDHFEVTSPLNNTTTGGTPKAAAGGPFTATVKAVCSDGTLTPNFSWETVLTAVAPNAGGLGTLGQGTLAVSTFVNGQSTPNDLSYSEVGNMTLSAVASGYLATTMDISGVSDIVGRFHPSYFTIDANTPTLTAGCSGFSYLDQPLLYAVQPQLTITARNSAGNKTLNYVGNWWKLGDIAETYVDSGMPGGVTIDPALASHTPQTTAATTAGEVVTTFWGPLSYQRPLGANVGPFDAALQLTVVVDDGDAQYNSGAAFSLDIPFDPAASTQIRHGRLSLRNSYGSEQLALSMPVMTEYFNGISFVENNLDSCTNVLLPQFTFTSPAGIAAANGVSSVSSGSGSVDWTNPVYPSGYVDVTIDLSTLYWLQFDWNADGVHDDNPPSARATFGIYKGSERIIYLRETTW